MSDDELSDDALDAEHANPAMVKRHAPRLAEPDDPASISRVVSLRDMRLESEMPSEKMRRDREEAAGVAVPIQTKPPLPPIPLRKQPPAPVAHPFRVPAPRDFGDADAWDKYAVGALPLVVGLVENHTQAAELAGQFADALLAERRKRFS